MHILLLLDHLRPILGSAVDTWVTVFVAIGTVGAVAYALFRDLFVVPRRRPKLDLRFDHTGNDQVVVGTAGGFEGASVRLRVANGEAACYAILPVSWDGKWSGKAAMWDHLRVEPPRKVR